MLNAKIESHSPFLLNSWFCSSGITLLISLLLMWKTVMICLYPCVYTSSHNFLRRSALSLHPMTAMCTYDDSCPCATALNRQYFFKEQLFLDCSFNSIVCKYQPESGIKKEMIFLMLFMIFTVSQLLYSCLESNSAVCAADSNQVTITRHKREINTLLQ